MTKNEFIDRRTKIISKLLDHPDEYGIFPTTTCFAELDDLFDQIQAHSLHGTNGSGPSWAQIHRDHAAKEQS